MKKLLPPWGGSFLFPALLAVFCFGLAFAGAEVQTILRYQRDAIGNGEIWRVLSGHFVHLGWSHLWLNLAGLLLIWLLVGGAFSFAGWSLVLFVAVLGTSAGLWIFQPEMRWYVGLSGALHGLLVAGALKLLRTYKDASLLLGLVALKVAWEQWLGPMPGSVEAAGGPVVVSAHLYGAVSGAIAFAFYLLWRRFQAKR